MFSKEAQVNAFKPDSKSSSANQPHKLKSNFAVTGKKAVTDKQLQYRK